MGIFLQPFSPTIFPRKKKRLTKAGAVSVKTSRSTTRWVLLPTVEKMDMVGTPWKITLPKFNMEPKNDGFQKESPIPGYHFQVPG